MALSHTSNDSSTHDYRASSLKLNAIDWVALALMIVGGINWGLVGGFNYDLVAFIFGVMTPAARSVYALVGLSALYGVVLAVKCARKV